MGSKQGARIFSQILAEPTFMVLGRYHYGVFNSYANIAKDLVRGSRGNKLDAIGNLFAMGLLSFAVYPMLDKAARWITGNDHAGGASRDPLPSLRSGPWQGKPHHSSARYIHPVSGPVDRHAAALGR
ncbi:hypothetical protein ACVINW_000150 [Bradyrhizobium sp. USDA 4461]